MVRALRWLDRDVSDRGTDRPAPRTRGARERRCGRSGEGGGRSRRHASGRSRSPRACPRRGVATAWTHRSPWRDASRRTEVAATWDWPRPLSRELPHTLRAMETGALSEWRATLIARETACLERAHRTRIDEEICSDTDRLQGRRRQASGGGACGGWPSKLEPAVASSTAPAVAERERRVTIRPAPDTMCYLTGCSPVAQGVAAYAALTRAADSARAGGDARRQGAGHGGHPGRAVDRPGSGRRRSPSGSGSS